VRSIALCLALWLAAACGGDDDGDGGEAPAADAAPGQPDAAAGPDDGGTSASCEQYCADITAACVGEVKQYFDLEECLASCAQFPPGRPGDQTGDSLACRAYHAQLAVSDPDPHCYHAGPSGNGVCGDPCDGYCDIMLAVCPAEFADDAACMTACAELPDPRPYSTQESRTDTVACRLFHATRAAVDDAHCGGASPDSTVCSEAL
jgi:hypothetical protein